jgi:nucleotide-binding universal stress UspA family protein
LNPLTSTAQLGSIILSCEIPCIVVPPHRRQAALEHIAVAWNGSSQAIRALHAARPLLARAKEITVLEGAPADDTIENHWSPRFDIGQYLLAHGLTARRESLVGTSGEAGERLLAAAHHCHANLLVMGAYGRSRLSEWMLGGATRSVLMDATMPVLLRH